MISIYFEDKSTSSNPSIGKTSKKLHCILDLIVDFQGKISFCKVEEISARKIIRIFFKDSASLFDIMKRNCVSLNPSLEFNLMLLHKSLKINSLESFSALEVFVNFCVVYCDNGRREVSFKLLPSRGS